MTTQGEARFYVYEHWRPDTGACFYVGKGQKRRAHNWSWRNPHHLAVQKKLERLGLKPEVRMVAVGLTEAAAFDLERERISYWREAGAPLVNRTDGGEGLSNPTEEVRRKISESQKGNKNMVGRRLSAETRARISAAHKGKKVDPAMIARLAEINRGNRHMVGRKLPAETRAKMSKARMGNKCALGMRHSAESRARMSAQRKGIKRSPETIEKMTSHHRKPVICIDDGLVFRSAVEAGHHYGLFNHAKVAEVCRGARRRAAGRQFRYIEARAQ